MNMWKMWIFLGAFAKFAKSDYYLRHVCLSVRMEQLGYHCTYFSEFRHLRIFRKSVAEIQVSLKPDKNNGYVT